MADVIPFHQVRERNAEIDREIFESDETIARERLWDCLKDDIEYELALERQDWDE